jgi:hypothetical protein
MVSLLSYSIAHCHKPPPLTPTQVFYNSTNPTAAMVLFLIFEFVMNVRGAGRGRVERQKRARHCWHLLPEATGEAGAK